MLDVSLPAAALGGLISFLSPCVLPLVPPYLSYLAGTTVSELNAGRDRQVRQRAVRAALLFVAGFTTVFVILGATASVVGQGSGIASSIATSTGIPAPKGVLPVLHMRGGAEVGPPWG